MPARLKDDWVNLEAAPVYAGVTELAVVVVGSVEVHKAVLVWSLGWLPLPIPPIEVVVDWEAGETVATGDTDVTGPV